MSMHDYTMHSKKNQEEVAEMKTVDEKLESAIIEPTEDIDTEATKATEETDVQPVEAKSYDLGVITGCNKLRVRSEPRFGTNVICELDRGTRVMIDKSASTFDYYKIYTEAGIEGFCQKTYIA